MNVREGLSVRKTQPVIYSPSSHSVLRAFPKKISWLRAEAGAPQTTEELVLPSSVPLLLAFRCVFFFCIIFVCHSSVRSKGAEETGGGGLKRSHTISIQHRRHRGGWCVQAQRGGFRHTLRLSVAVPSEAKDMMLQSRLSAVQNKHNSGPASDDARCFFPNRSPRGEACLKTDHTSQLGPAEMTPHATSRLPKERGDKVYLLLHYRHNLFFFTRPTSNWLFCNACFPPLNH